MPPPSSASGRMLTARIRVVSEKRLGQRHESLRKSARARSPLSGIGEAVAGAVERLDRSELRVDGAELAPQALDVAVDRAVVDEDIVGIGGIHQLVAALD